MKLYFFMALEGSICILLYLLFKWISPYEWSLRQRQFFLRINMLLYLIPIPWLVYQGRTFWTGIGRMLGISKTRDTQTFVTQPNTWRESINVTTGKFLRVITIHHGILVVGVAVMLVMLMVLAIWFAVFLITSHRVKRNMTIVGARTVGNKKIPMALSAGVQSPAVVGVFRQVILFPEHPGEYSRSMQDSVIAHETQHIVHRDGLFKVLSWLVLSLHWYNPLVYYLYQEHSKVNEMRCDQRATSGMSEQEKKNYMNCILESATEPSTYHLVKMNLGGSGKVLQERMNRIMNKNGKKTWKRYLAVVTMAACLMVSSIPAMAYEESRNVEGNFNPANGWGRVDLMQFVVEQKNGEMDLASLDFTHSHCIFIDDNGNVYECGEQVEGRVFCFHDYVSGTVAFHESNPDGSCLVTTYNAIRCDICGKIILAEKKYDEFWHHCPHTEGYI